MGERLRIRFEADGPEREEELRSLLDWLADDRSLRGHLRLERIEGDSPGRMSPEIAAVLAVISTAAGVLQLPLSYLAWRQSRSDRTPPVTVRIIGGDPARAEELLRALRGETPEDGPDEGRT
ncbi:hypothetical protein AB0E75_12855 [Streptomyces griseoviridis]|jgi:hypothetical protein|uniref:Uncharacterized protein n=1 Tax=Streptomyces griseoviridis TaxID=45398 RepID=A0A918GHZ1_STRGD|nr:hypothetical protein [Streptomyces niveoruber]GGS38733.1 hypothetical protein GCM10010238_30280 [Streptomyces niveoruber]